MHILNDGLDIAKLLMYGAFDELKAAHKLMFVGQIEVEMFDAMECFELAAQIEAKHFHSRRPLIKATVLFQSGMEAVINHWRSKHPEIIGNKKDFFVEKWENAFNSKISIDNKDLVKDLFDNYKTFYDYRNCVIHPNSLQEVAVINSLHFLDVHSGFHYGWDVFAHLAAVLDVPHDQNSWEMMCEICEVPSNPLASDFPDLLVLQNSLRERYLKQINQPS